MRPSPGLSGHQQRHMRTVDLWRVQRVEQPHGGYDQTWTFQHAARASIAPAQPTERATASQEGVEVTHSVKLPLGTDVVRGDRVVTSEGTSIEVVYVDTTSTRRNVLNALGRIEPWDEPTNT